jgi:hypothetical protein
LNDLVLNFVFYESVLNCCNTFTTHSVNIQHVKISLQFLASSLSISRDIMIPKDDPAYAELMQPFAVCGVEWYDDDSDSETRLSMMQEDDMESLVRFLAIIRSMLSNENTEVFEDFKERLETFLTWCYAFSYLHDSLVLKEFIFSEKFSECVIQNNLFLRFALVKVFRVTSVIEVIVSCKATDDVSLTFKNILLRCRFLPLRWQTDIYRKIGEIYMNAKAVSKVYNQHLPNFESLVPCLFELDPFLVNACKGSPEDCHTLYCEATSSYLKSILDSGVHLVSDTSSLSKLLIGVWTVCKAQHVSWESFIKSFLSKAIKSYQKSFREKKLTEVDKVFQKESSIKYLSAFILALYARKLDQKRFLVALKGIAAHFKDKRANACLLKGFLSEILVDLPKEKWVIETLPYMRICQKNTR